MQESFPLARRAPVGMGAPGDTIDWGLVVGSGAAILTLVGLFFLAIEGAGKAVRRSNPVRRKKPMHVQSLLFARTEWTPERAMAWARRHGYVSKKVDVTERNVRLRQAPPDRFKVLRTIPFGRGIKAVVGR